MAEAGTDLDLSSGAAVDNVLTSALGVAPLYCSSLRGQRAREEDPIF